MVATPTKKPPPDGLKPKPINRIDMREMTQSELYSLSLRSSTVFDLNPMIDVLTPTIDRRIFNESAASRGQTHSRNRHNSSAVVGRRIRLPRSPLAPSPNDPAIADGKSIVKHLKNLLFPADQSQPQPPPSTTTQVGNVSEVASGDVEIGVVGLIGEQKRKRRRRKKTELVEKGGELGNPPTQPPPAALAQVGSGSAADMGIADLSGDRKMKRRRRKKMEIVEKGGEWGNPPTNHSQPAAAAATQVGSGSAADMGIADFSGEKERKRKRGEKQVAVVEDVGEIKLEILNKEGVVVDFRALENGDQVFDEEFKKRTIGLETEEEFLRFLGGLEGKWGSTRKKRRIVDAGEFSNALPVGWKLLLALKRQQYRPFLFCRRYISPNGKQFMSCKEAALYLQSYFGNVSEVASGAGEIGIVGLSEERKKTEIVENGSEFGNPPIHHSQSPVAAVTQEGNGSVADMRIADLSGERNRKRKRKEKQVVVVEDGGEIELGSLNMEGVEVDFRALENGDQVFDEEFKKRTIGLETEEEFLRFLGSLEGKWGSTRKKRRIVDAGEFSNALPVGWKLLLALKRQQYRPFLFCRRYLSPNGKQFVSCKEAALYLQSYFGLDDPSQPSSLTGKGVVERPAGHVQADQNAAKGAPDSVLPRLLPVTPHVQADQIVTNGTPDSVLPRLLPVTTTRHVPADQNAANGTPDSVLPRLLPVTTTPHVPADQNAANGTPDSVLPCLLPVTTTPHVPADQNAANGTPDPVLPRLLPITTTPHVLADQNAAKGAPDSMLPRMLPITLHVQADQIETNGTPDSVLPRLLPVTLHVQADQIATNGAPDSLLPRLLPVTLHVQADQIATNGTPDSVLPRLLPVTTTPHVPADQNAANRTPDPVLPRLLPVTTTPHVLADRNVANGTPDSVLPRLLPVTTTPHVPAYQNAANGTPGSVLPRLLPVTTTPHVPADRNAAYGTSDSVLPRMLPVITTPLSHAKDLNLDEIEKLPEVSVKDELLCYQCAITFDEMTELWKHLIKFHERTTRLYNLGPLGSPVGNHQCQVGHERSQEKTSCESPMAVREKDNLRSSKEFPGKATVQKRNKSPFPNEKAKVVTIPESPDANLDSEAIPQNKVAESSLTEERSRGSHLGIGDKDNLTNSEKLRAHTIVQKKSESASQNKNKPKISRMDAVVQKKSKSASQNKNKPKISRMDAVVDISQKSVSKSQITKLNDDKANGGSSFHNEVEVTIPVTPAANSDNEAILQKGAAESSLPDVESLDCFASFITVSDKEEEGGFQKVDQNFNYTTGFEDLTNFSFLNGQDSPHLPDSMNLPNTEGMEEGLNSAAETGKYQFTAVCVWCQSKFDYEAVGLETESKSVGFMCRDCKARISGQFNMLDSGSSMNSFL